MPLPDAIDALAELLGVSRRELVGAIVKASHKAWQRELQKQLRRQLELPDEENDLEDLVD